MVSALWKACSEGDLPTVLELLKDASSVDIELKHHTGVTPLIEAIKNSHVEIVRALLEKGADPTNSSSHGRPEQYTTDPIVLEMLEAARSKMTSSGMPAPESSYVHDLANPQKGYYGPPPPGTYTYYPSLNSAPPALPDGALYYPPPPPHTPGESHSPGGPGNLPPPEIARFIPCRYFPACRYGASCIFAHPQGPYFQGPLPPPAQYVPPYDPMAPQPYAPGYYAVPPPPPSFQPPNNIHPMTPLSPTPLPPMAHGRSPSELMSPSQNHFQQNGAPYGPVSPSNYSHPPHIPVPLMGPPLPPHHQPAVSSAGPQSPNGMYHNSSTTPFPVHSDPAGQYPPAQGNDLPVKYQDANGPKSPILNGTNGQPDTFALNSPHRDNMGHRRGGAGRRTSFGGRKPPCFFYPTGRCKNGDDCRFPHVIPDGTGPHHAPSFPGRGGAPRGRHQYGTIEEKFSSMTVRDQTTDDVDRTQSNDSAHRPRFYQGARQNHPPNGIRTDKKPPAKQRVPNADEFPVLGGSTTPPSRSPGSTGTPVTVNGINGHGPTAAQVLQAPPPFRKDGGKDVRGSPTHSVDSVASKEGGNVEQAVNGKHPPTFAAMANVVTDVAQEVSVSA